MVSKGATVKCACSDNEQILKLRTPLKKWQPEIKIYLACVGPCWYWLSGEQAAMLLIMNKTDLNKQWQEQITYELSKNDMPFVFNEILQRQQLYCLVWFSINNYFCQDINILLRTFWATQKNHPSSPSKNRNLWSSKSSIRTGCQV